MRILPVKFIFFLLAVFGPQSVVAQSCPSGLRKLSNGEPCIPEQLFNYLYCLKQSGGGKIEVQEKSNNSATKKLEISVEGKAAGVILSGGGAAGFKKEDVQRSAKEFSQKLDPTLAERCQSFIGLMSGQVAPSKADLESLFGIKVRLGSARSEVQSAVPEGSWQLSEAGKAFLTVQSSFLGIPGTLRLWVEADRVQRAVFNIEHDGAEWITNKNGEEVRRGKNGKPLTFAQALNNCRPVLSIKSKLVEYYGAPSRVVDSEQDFDPTANWEKQGERRGKVAGHSWTFDYKINGANVRIGYLVYTWDVAMIKYESPIGEERKNYHCKVTVTVA